MPKRQRTEYQKWVVAELAKFWVRPLKKLSVKKVFKWNKEQVQKELRKVKQEVRREKEEKKVLLPTPTVTFHTMKKDDPTLWVFWRGMPPYLKVKDRHKILVFGMLLDKCGDLGLRYKDMAVRVWTAARWSRGPRYLTTAVIMIPPAEGEYDERRLLEPGQETPAPDAAGKAPSEGAQANREGDQGRIPEAPGTS